MAGFKILIFLAISESTKLHNWFKRWKEDVVTAQVEFPKESVLTSAEEDWVTWTPPFCASVFAPLHCFSACLPSGLLSRIWPWVIYTFINPICIWVGTKGENGWRRVGEREREREGGCCWFLSVFLKDTAALFQRGWDPIPVWPSPSPAPIELLQASTNSVQPQRLMNNKIIIPIHAVIKWDWLYLPVCSHWAQSSIIIPSGGVWPRECAYAWVWVSVWYACVFVTEGAKSHTGACEDKQSQREENDTNQLKHYCPLYSRLIRSSQGAGGLYRHKHPDIRPSNCRERSLHAALTASAAPN